MIQTAWVQPGAFWVLLLSRRKLKNRSLKSCQVQSLRQIQHLSCGFIPLLSCLLRLNLVVERNGADKFSTICVLTKREKNNNITRCESSLKPLKLHDRIRIYLKIRWMNKCVLSLNTERKGPPDFKQIHSPKSRLHMIPLASNTVCFYFPPGGSS